MTRPEPVNRRLYRRKSFRFVAAGTALTLLGLGVSHAAGASARQQRHFVWWHQAFAATHPIGGLKPGAPVRPPAAKPPAAKPPAASPTSTAPAPPAGGGGGGAGGGAGAGAGGNAPTAGETQTIGSGSLSDPAQGPGVEFADQVLKNGEKPVLIKNWDFGANGTVPDIGTMSKEFDYHDQFGTIGNGTNYGAQTAAPSPDTAIGGQQVNTSVRTFTGDSLQTFLVPKNAGAQTVDPSAHDVLNGSFMAKFQFPSGGSRLKHEIVWQTRVKYVTPPEFWFALWNSGDQWDKGAEFDVVESFGFDNTVDPKANPRKGSDTEDGKQEDKNFNGRWWHSDPVGAKSEVDYSNFPTGMRSVGAIKGNELFDATAYHTWTLVYRTDDTFSFFVDGTEAQHGTMNWTLGGGADGKNINFRFLFDAGWGHTQIASVNYPLPAKDLQGKFYDFDYSRVYETP